MELIFAVISNGNDLSGMKVLSGVELRFLPA